MPREERKAPNAVLAGLAVEVLRTNVIFGSYKHALVLMEALGALVELVEHFDDEVRGTEGEEV